MRRTRIEQLDHVRIVVAICQEITLARLSQQFSVGTAALVMTLNGLTLSKRRLYLVSLFTVDPTVKTTR